MQSNFYAGARADATTTVATFLRITAVRGCTVAFILECFGIDAAGKKILVEVYRGSTSGTPGTAITGKAFDGEDDSLDKTLVATLADKFSSEAGYTAGNLIDKFTVHPQVHRPSRAYWLNPAEKLDVRLTVQDSGANTGCMITANVRG